MRMAERDIIENAKSDLYALACLVGAIYRLEDSSDVNVVCPYLESRINDIGNTLYELARSTSVDEAIL